MFFVSVCSSCGIHYLTICLCATCDFRSWDLHILQIWSLVYNLSVTTKLYPRGQIFSRSSIFCMLLNLCCKCICHQIFHLISLILPISSGLQWFTTLMLHLSVQLSKIFPRQHRLSKFWKLSLWSLYQYRYVFACLIVKISLIPQA